MKLRKVGNSQGVLIPSGVMKAWGISAGDSVEMAFDGLLLVLVPAQAKGALVGVTGQAPDNTAALELLDALDREDSEADDGWDDLRANLERHRTSNRRLFP